MVINYFGAGCFKIQSGNLSLAVDPVNDRLKPDILLRTVAPLPLKTPAQNEIAGPGEYETLGVIIRGYQLVKESSPKLIKTIYRVEMEDIALGFLGEAENIPDGETLEKLGRVDILFLPVEGKPYLEAEKAAKLVKQLRPAIAIPSFAKNPKDFFEEMGQEVIFEEKLSLKKKDVAVADGAKIICLKA